MPTYVITAPDGKEYEIDAPDGASQEQALAYFQSNWQPKKTEQTKERGYGEEALRQLGLTGRAALQGIGGVPQILGGAMEAAGLKGAGVNVGRQFADYLGLPTPETTIEQVAGSGASAMAGGAPFLKAGQVLASAPSEITKRVGAVMAAQPTAQIGLSVVSGGASEAAKVGGVGEAGQFAAGLVAPMIAAPAAALTTGAGLVAKNIIAPLVSQEAAERGAAKLAVKASGQRAEQVAQALASSKGDETAGQIATAIENTDLAALQAIANKRDATLAEVIKQGVDAKIKQGWKALEERLAPQREDALSLAGQGGIDPTPILNRIQSIASARGNRSDDVVQSAMKEFAEKIRSITKDGIADPFELNTIRKQLGTTIGKFSKENAVWDKKKTATLERELQLGIDNAIESAISRADPTQAGAWSQKYMREYASGANALSVMEDAVKREAQLASKGMGAVRKSLGEAETPIQGVNFLSRIATIANAAIRLGQGSAGAKVEQSLARMMAPQEYGGDTQLLGRLMRQEMDKPQGLLASMQSGSPVSRAALGYGNEQPQRVVKPTITEGPSFTLPPEPLPPLRGAPPLIPGTDRMPMQPRPAGETPLPVLPDELRPLSEQTSGSLGIVQEGGEWTNRGRAPLPELPQPVGYGRVGAGMRESMLSGRQPQPASAPFSQGIDFPLRQEVLQRPEMVSATNAFINEANALKSIIDNSYIIDKRVKANARAKLNAVEDEFMAGLKQMGIRSEAEARNLMRKLYESGRPTQLPIERTFSPRGMMTQ